MTLLQTELAPLLGEAARIAAEYLEEHGDRSLPVTRILAPDELERRLKPAIPREGRGLEPLLDDLRGILRYSVRTGSPRFFNQLFGGFQPAALLGEWMAAVANTSMYTYEAAPVGTVLEKAVIDKMNALAGFRAGDGILAPGGSLSNLMAVLAARQRAFPSVKEEGLPAGVRPVLFLSEEAHYSLTRAAIVSGLGSRGAIPVAADDAGRMVPAALEEAIARERKAGRQPFLVAATAGTTVCGAFDPLPEIGAVARREGLWFHVDGSSGASVLLSPRHAPLVAGIEQADSVTWNPHKMMGVPLSCSALLMREKGRLEEAFSMQADYLFHEGGFSAWDTGKKTIQCGRRLDALKLWLAWQALGDDGMRRRIDRLFELSEWFQKRMESDPGFELVRKPQATNICFRWLPEHIRALPPGPERRRKAHRFTLALRDRLIRSGKFMINYATLDGAAVLRLVLLNPATTEEDLECFAAAIP